MNTEPIIEVKEVYKSFKTVQAVKGISLNIQQGQFVAVLGPNGAGKTTLVEMIEGIQKPNHGEIFIMKKKWKGNEDELHHIIGLSLQETRFIDKLTTWETLKLFASFYQLEQQRVAEIIEIIGLEDKRKSYVVNLSGGQRQRLALGIALLNYPKILLLDEPTTGLDPNARREVWSILFKLREQTQTTLILTTHYMEEAEQLCDYIIVMDHGEILKEGTLNQLLDEDHGQKIIEFTLEESHLPEDVLKGNSAFQIQWDSSTKKGVVVVNQLENGLAEFFNLLIHKKLSIKNLECRKKTLDDLFISLTGRHLNE
jgi:ABC-2 type transport system ATP-binding protein